MRSQRARILVVEDDPKTAAALDLYLRHAGFETAVAHAGDEALSLSARLRPALVVLDLMLPGIDGLEVCRALRATGSTAIILLTARATEADKVRGLELGADDYVTKPFSPRELVARVRAVLRRALEASAGAAIEAGDLRLDLDAREVHVGERRVALTPAEFRLLHAFAQAPGRVFSREELARRVSGDDHEALERTIDAHVKNLRRKIEERRDRPTRIVTVLGAGYRLVAHGVTSR